MIQVILLERKPYLYYEINKWQPSVVRVAEEPFQSLRRGKSLNKAKDLNKYQKYDIGIHLFIWAEGNKAL